MTDQRRSLEDEPLLSVHPELMGACRGLWNLDRALTDLVEAYTNGPAHQAELIEVSLQLAHLLLVKNQGYGNSALEPMAVFSKADRWERLGVRMDDKLNRLARGAGGVQEDTEFDLAGYIVLRTVARKQDEREERTDVGLRHQKHYRSCNCLGDSATCCDPACPCG